MITTRLKQAGERIRLLLTKAGSREDGQGLVEYALIIILFSVAVIAAVGAFGSTLSDRYDLIIDSIVSL